MEPTVAILARFPDQNLRLTTALEDLDVFDVMSFQDAASLVAWCRSHVGPVAAFFLDEATPEILTLLRSLPSGEHSLLYEISSTPKLEETHAGSALADLLDSVVIKPFLRAAFEEKVTSMVKSRQRKKMSALLVDETRESRESICRSLAECGFLTVYEAEDTEAAQGVLNRAPDAIAIVVVCGEIPSDNSLQFLNGLKQDPRFSKVPFVLITSQRSLEIARQAQTNRGTVTKFSLPPAADELRAKAAAVEEAIVTQAQVDSFFREAAMFLKRGAVHHAVEILGHAVKIHSKAPLLLEKLGDMHANDFEDPGFLDKAITVYRRVLSERPDSRNAVLKCGDLLIRLERFDEAIRLYRDFLVSSVFDSEIRTRLAKLFIQKGDYGAACVELRRILSLDPGQKEATMLFQMAQSLNQSPAAPSLRSNARG